MLVTRRFVNCGMLRNNLRFDHQRWVHQLAIVVQSSLLFNSNTFFKQIQTKLFSTSQIQQRAKLIPKMNQENVNMQKKLQVKYSEDFINLKVEEYNLSKRRLAQMMGENPETFTADDVKNAIKYLFPSDLFYRSARPSMEHPRKVFPAATKIEADKEGRPYHHLFYMRHPEVSSALSEVYSKILEAQQMHDDNCDKLPPPPLNLEDSHWISINAVEKLLSCATAIPERLYQDLIAQLERLVEEKYAENFKDYIMKYRVKVTLQRATTDIPEVKVDEDGRKYSEGRGKRKTAIASAKVFENGSGKITINGKPMGEFFNLIPDRETLVTPFAFLGRLRQYNVEAEVDGGFIGTWSVLGGHKWKYSGTNKSAMAGAIRLAISRALLAYVSEEDAEQMRRAGLLNYDIRTRERKKPGQEGARRKFSWVKR